MNSGLGVAADGFYDNNAVEIALKFSFYRIQMYLDPTGGTTTKLTNTVFSNILAGIQCDLVMMRCLQAQHMQKNTLSDVGAIQSFFKMMPALTYEHKEMLEQIKFANRDVTIHVYEPMWGAKVL